MKTSSIDAAAARTASRSARLMSFALAAWMAGSPSVAQTPMPKADNTSRTFYVSPSGDDSADGRTIKTPFRTLQHAADKTVPGDTVDVMSGTYTNDKGSYALLAISTPGTPGAWITYQAYPLNDRGSAPVLQGDGKAWDVVRFRNTAAYVTLSGFTVTGNDANVTLANAQANEKEPAKHPETNGNCISVDGRDGSAGLHPHHLRILNNVASQCPGGGIATINADYITIEGNTVYNNSWYGAYGTSGISLLCSLDTDLADTTTPYKMIVERNVIYGNQEFIPWYSYKPPTITDGEGIIVDSNKNSAYAAAATTNPPYTGRTLVANNVVYANGSAAIEVFQSAHVDVVNNSTYADVLTPVETGRGELNLNVASDVRVLNNIFVSAQGQNPVTMGSVCTGGCVLDYNQYFGGKNVLMGMTEGKHDLAGDPMYVAPATGAAGLRLNAASPAVGSGTAVGGMSIDSGGKSRPQKTDRGAYQR